jgi:hypothetical protein
MELPAPAMDEWRRLYEAAIELKKQAPWEWMWEDEVFGVRNPETGEIGYVSIMGANGEHLALAVYLGSEGLDGFRQMSQGRGFTDPYFLLEIPQLQVSFEDRNTLHAKDREVIKSLGLKFRGRLAWPMFRNYTPGCMPWFVTPQDARFLTVVIEQALDVTHRLGDDRGLLEPAEPGQLLVRVQAAQGWSDEWPVPEPVKARSLPKVDTRRLTAMRQQFPHQKFSLEADLFVMPSAIQEKDDPRPLLPYLLLIVEGRSGMIVGNEIAVAKPALDAVWAQAQMGMMDTITRLQAIPQQISVRDQRLHDLLVPIAAGLGIRLKVARRLRALDEARAAFEAWMG